MVAARSVFVAPSFVGSLADDDYHDVAFVSGPGGGLVLLRTSWPGTTKQYPDDLSLADHDTHAAAECAAMKGKIGLWSDAHPTQPQEFRHNSTSPPLCDANGCRRSSEPTSGPVVGNSQSHLFEWPGCPYCDAISADYQVPFPSPQAAEAAGHRPAHNCP